ncbi:uncharacterized protein ARMOST_15907 [Armillaria ostoyae]|uniref:Uncharacterized protein n=1 Tax=Armillaria ostoyae TaxID=47428 RepID=A0A284RUR1_ARMOS|nr:uncharacterized protein ARMOST_15907 [Armillaria ostoyae]
MQSPPEARWKEAFGNSWCPSVTTAGWPKCSPEMVEIISTRSLLQYHCCASSGYRDGVSIFPLITSVTVAPIC